MATETEIGAWAVWHPAEGFGRSLYVDRDIDGAVADRDEKRKFDSDEKWKVVPVRIVRVDHT